jgi:hypothetical protein
MRRVETCVVGDESAAEGVVETTRWAAARGRKEKDERNCVLGVVGHIHYGKENALTLGPVISSSWENNFKSSQLIVFKRILMQLFNLFMTEAVCIQFAHA